MCQSRESTQRIQIRELLHSVAGHDESCEVGYAAREGGLDSGDAVAREEEGAQTGGEGEVGEGGNVVVC